MTEASSPTGEIRRPASGDGLADRLLQRAGSPGLVDAAAVQAKIARRIEWLGQLFPILPRLLARAAVGDADSFTGSALLATPFDFRAGEFLAAPTASITASPFGEVTDSSAGLAQRTLETSSQSAPSVASPSQLVRVSRVWPGGSVPTGSGDGVGMITASLASSPAATRANGAAAATPATGPRITTAHGRGEVVAPPMPLGRSPGPPSGTLPALDPTEDRGLPVVSPVASSTQGAGPDIASAAAVSSVRELSMPRRGRVEMAGEPFFTEASFAPVTGANLAPTARTSVVPELRASAPPGATMVLPASYGERPRAATASRPALTPVETNPTVTVVPKPAVSPVSAIAGAELERLAEKVSRVIARQIVVERERRGR